MISKKTIAVAQVSQLLCSSPALVLYYAKLPRDQVFKRRPTLWQTIDGGSSREDFDRCRASRFESLQNGLTFY